MWIRSQDKTELINTERIEVESENIYAYQPIQDGYLKIGIYKNKERALEVLNSIQNTITTYEQDKIYNLATAGTDYCTRDLCPVFEMPEE